MISKKKFGTTVTAFGVAAGMLLGSAAPAHAEENHSPQTKRTAFL